jgi:putative glycosyltransferase (TIGR04372 family)
MSLIRRVLRVGTDAVGLMLAGLLFAVLWLIEPIWRIRIVKMMDTRIGHLCINTDLVMRRLQISGRPPRTSLLFVASGGEPANLELLVMWQRHITIFTYRPVIRLLQVFLRLVEKTRFWWPSPARSIEAKEFALAAPTLTLSAADEARGRAALAHMGLGPDDWFVCFHNRDPAFLNTARPGTNWSYHDFRDFSLASLMPTAEHIAERGGFAFRMGSVVADRLTGGSPRVIDYSNRFHDPFLDIYLSARCRFFIGNGGLHQVPLVFDRPLLYINSIPHYSMFFGKSSLYIPKLLRHAGTGDYVHFADIHRMGGFVLDVSLNRSQWYASQGLEPVENSAEDILAACRDMFDLLDGKSPCEDDLRVQAYYKERFFSHNEEQRLYAPNLAPSFARKYRHLIEVEAEDVPCSPL